MQVSACYAPAYHFVLQGKQKTVHVFCYTNLAALHISLDDTSVYLALRPTRMQLAGMIVIHVSVGHVFTNIS